MLHIEANSFLPVHNAAEHYQNDEGSWIIELLLFFLDIEPIYSVEYWDEGDYQEIIPLISQFVKVAKAVQSRFFPMDVAKRIDGDWMIIELGDAQVAGLPDNADDLGFYRAFSQYALAVAEELTDG